MSPARPGIPSVVSAADSLEITEMIRSEARLLVVVVVAVAKGRLMVCNCL